MQYSWLPQEPRKRIPRVPPPVVISRQRFARIIANATKAEQQAQLAEQQQRRRYSEELRDGGEALLSQFTCGSQLQQQRQLAAVQPEPQKSVSLERAEIRREQQRLREQRIAKAQLLLEQLRPGPRDLHCAKLQSEVMRAINAQHQLQADFAKAAQEQQELDRRSYNEKVLKGLQQAQQSLNERQQRLAEHKCELLQAIEQRRQERSEQTAQQLQQATEERERHQRWLQAQIDRERAAKSQMQHQRRADSMAALDMSQQQQQRLKMLDEVEQLQCEVHNAAKQQLETLKLGQGRQRIVQRLRKNEQLAKELAPRLHYSASKDNARHERELASMRKAFSGEEQQRRQRLEQTMLARQAAQKQEQQLVKQAQKQTQQERMQQEALRLENERIYLDYKFKERQQQLQTKKELRQKLDEQLQERAAVEAKPETNYNRDAQLECLRQDKFFFNYAHELMSEAQAKGCPLRPFVRAVAQYKNDNRIGAKVRVPRHLVTKLNMGLRAEGDSRAVAEAKEQKSKQDSETKEQQHMASIMDNLQKIEALVLTEAKEKSITK